LGSHFNALRSRYKHLNRTDRHCNVFSSEKDKERPTNKTNGLNPQQDTEVVIQLIKHYRSIFPEDPEELQREKLMLKVGLGVNTATRSKLEFKTGFEKAHRKSARSIQR